MICTGSLLTVEHNPWLSTHNGVNHRKLLPIFGTLTLWVSEIYELPNQRKVDAYFWPSPVDCVALVFWFWWPSFGLASATRFVGRNVMVRVWYPIPVDRKTDVDIGRSGFLKKYPAGPSKKRYIPGRSALLFILRLASISQTVPGQYGERIFLPFSSHQLQLQSPRVSYRWVIHNGLLALLQRKNQICRLPPWAAAPEKAFSDHQERS